jgi:hypothetical protein
MSTAMQPASNRYFTLFESGQPITS